MIKTNILILVLALCIAMEITKADFIVGTPTNLGPTVNSTDAEGPDDIAADGLSLFLTSGQSGGYGVADIWVSKRPTTEDDWGVPVNLGPTVNSSDWDGASSITGNGLSLFLSSFRPGGDGVFTDIWVTTRATVSDPWGIPTNLGPVVNTSRYDERLDVSDDGLTLLFSSNRPGGEGQSDIWVTKRPTVFDPWGTPTNLGPIVNSWKYDGAPNVSSDGRMLFFSSNRAGGLGGEDIWLATRATKDDDWANPVNLGPKVNTSHADSAPCLSPDGSVLYFMSLRPGGVGSLDIWQVSINPILDFNGDGSVDAADMCLIVDHWCEEYFWGEDYFLYDIGPMPWGDGIVDVQDLVVLADHLFEEVNDPTLVSHWALDETEGMTAHDSVSGNNDFVMGGALWWPTGGKMNGAIELDGIDDSIITSTLLSPTEESFSIVAWVKGGKPGQVIISQPNGSDWLVIDAEGKLMTELNGLDQSATALFSQAFIADEQWHRIGLVWDGSRRMLFVDGVTVAEDTQDGLGFSSSGLYIGVGKNYTSGSFFSGLIDDIRIYNRVVSP